MKIQHNFSCLAFSVRHLYYERTERPPRGIEMSERGGSCRSPSQRSLLARHRQIPKYGSSRIGDHRSTTGHGGSFGFFCCVIWSTNPSRAGPSRNNVIVLSTTGNKRKSEGGTGGSGRICKLETLSFSRPSVVHEACAAAWRGGANGETQTPMWPAVRAARSVSPCHKVKASHRL